MATTIEKSALQAHFNQFRENTIGAQLEFETPFGKKPLVYADWTASGRLYSKIEDILKNDFGPLVGNTHTETNHTRTSMTYAYHEAQHIIKRHAHAQAEDVLLTVGA